MRRLSIVFTSLIVGLATWTVSAQQRPVFRAGANTVRVDVLVTDNHKPVAGLQSDDFEVLDNGVRQDASVITTAGSVAVALVLDLSDNMAGAALEDLLQACNALADALAPGDVAWVVTYSDQFRLNAGPVQNAGAIREAISRVKTRVGTSMWDAVFASTSLVTGAAGRSLVLVMSDGLDTSSWLEQKPALDALKRSEVVIDAIMPRAPSSGFLALETLTTTTGGDVMSAATGEHSRDQLVRILDEFRAGYVLSYTPTGVKTGDGWHTLKVRLRNRPGKVQARAGYDARAIAK